MVQSLICPPVGIGCFPKVSIVSGVQVNTTDKDSAVITVHLEKHAEGEGLEREREEGDRREVEREGERK